MEIGKERGGEPGEGERERVGGMKKRMFGVFSGGGH